SDADDALHGLNDKYGLGSCGNGAAPPGECSALQKQRQSVDSSRNLEIGAFVVGGVAAVAAGYFYWDALSHRKAEGAAASRPLLDLMPSVDIGRARAIDAASIGSVKLSVSGKF